MHSVDDDDVDDDLDGNHDHEENDVLNFGHDYVSCGDRFKNSLEQFRDIPRLAPGADGRVRRQVDARDARCRCPRLRCRMGADVDARVAAAEGLGVGPGLRREAGRVREHVRRLRLEGARLDL